MNTARKPKPSAPLRATARLEGDPGRIAASELMGFAETLVRDAISGSQVAGASMHVLGAGNSTKVTGEAVFLGEAGAPVWRVSINDESGAALAEVTLTLATVTTAEAPTLADAPARRTAADDKRTAIALAARDVFAEKGYAAATMREIAAAAGMHVPTMYQYFRSKDEILELVYSWTITQAVDGMADTLAASGPVDQKMDAIVRRLHDLNEELRRGTRVMNRETRSLSRAARDRVLGHYAEMIDDIAVVIAEGQKAGLYREMDPKLAAVFVDALADVWALRPFAVRDVDSETYAAELVAFVRGALMGPTAKSPDTPEPDTK